MGTIIRSPNWIGDGIMCLPAIRAYKESFPNEHLAVAAKRYLAALFHNIPEIDEIVPLPDRWTTRAMASHIRKVRQRGFRRGILFTNSFSSALFFRLAGIRNLAGYARDGRGFLLHDQVPPPASGSHHQYYYLNIIEHLSGQSAGRPLSARLVVSAEEKEWAENWLREQGVTAASPLLAVSPTAAYGSAKAWPPDRFREVVRRWLQNRPGAAVLLLGGQAEREKIAAIAKGLPANVLNLAGRLDLRRSIAVLSRCRLFVGNDSGLMHVAAALSVPLVAVFGPTEPGGTAPLADHFRLVYHGAECAPCRRRECPSDHRCMTAVSVNEVLVAATELWQETE